MCPPTLNRVEAFWSLKASNQMVVGFISSVLGHKINNKYVVLAKVRHSQRMNDPFVQIWTITNKDGTVFSALCASCTAGLGRCCSHIASVSFYIEYWIYVNGKLSCTQVNCTWLLWKYQVNPRGSPRDRVGNLPLFCARGVWHCHSSLPGGRGICH